MSCSQSVSDRHSASTALHNVYTNATAPMATNPGNPNPALALALFTPAPLDPGAPLALALTLLACALRTLATLLTAAVFELTRLLIGSDMLVIPLLLPPPVSEALALALVAMLPLSNAVMVPVASEVSKKMLSRVADADADTDPGALALGMAVSEPDCVIVATVTEFAFVFVMVSVFCALTVAARTTLQRMEVRMVAGVPQIPLLCRAVVSVLLRSVYIVLVVLWRKALEGSSAYTARPVAIVSLVGY